MGVSSELRLDARMRRPILVGAAAGVSLLLAYSVVLILLQGPGHALEQSIRLWYWLLALAAGFGAQIGLFFYLRQRLREKKMAANASVAASGSVSVGSMIACCAHHLTEILPLIGLSGITAFLATYQVVFMIIGILANMIGITIMLETIQRLGLWTKLSQWRGNMGLIKKLTMASAIVIVPVAFLLIS